MQKSIYKPDPLLQLEIREHIRKRPGMYVGSTNIRGIRFMLQELFANINRINSDLNYEVRFTIIEGKEFQIEFSKIKALDTISFDPNSIHGLISLDIFCLNYLSEKFSIWQDDAIIYQSSNGLSSASSLSEISELVNLKIVFIPDPEIFQNVHYSYSYFYDFLKWISYLMKNVIFYLYEDIDHKQINIFNNSNGVFDLFNEELIRFYAPPTFLMYKEYYYKNNTICIAIAYGNPWYSSCPKQNSTTFANFNELIWGGDLYDGIISAISKALKSIIKNLGHKPAINKKEIKEVFFTIASINNPNNEFIFNGSTRWSLSDPGLNPHCSEKHIN